MSFPYQEGHLQSVVFNESWYQKPLVIVILGASGDLARKKTYPSLLELYQHNLLPRKTVIWGFARTVKTHDELRDHLRPHLTINDNNNNHNDNNDDQLPPLANPDKTVEQFLKMCFYHSGSSYGDGSAYERMLEGIKCAAAFSMTDANLLYYLAIPPNVFHQTVKTLERIPGAVVQSSSSGTTKFVIEKPFGRDTASCQELLNSFKGLGEDMQYRLDHYLAKPMVENLVTMRTANPWMEHMWSHQFVESVHIRFKEPFGTQGRGGYFDQFNIIRDVLQNHIIQLLLLVAMELPPSFESNGHKDSNDGFRQAKIAVLERMPPILLEDALLGQYEGYSDDPTIKNKHTNCPTYAALRCFVNNQRWKGVPFVLEAGKALDEKIVDVQIIFKNRHPFPSNKLSLEVQPKPRIGMTTHVRPLDSIASRRGKTVHTSTLTADYTAEEHHHDDVSNLLENDYSRLLLDVMRGNQNNFVRSDELIRSWEIFTPLLHRIEGENVQPEKYVYGSDGPPSRPSFLDEMLHTQVKASL